MNKTKEKKNLNNLQSRDYSTHRKIDSEQKRYTVQSYFVIHFVRDISTYLINIKTKATNDRKTKA